MICVLPEGALVSGDSERIHDCFLQTPLASVKAQCSVLFSLPPALIRLVMQYPHTTSTRVMLMTFNWSFPSHQQVVNYILACSAGTSTWVTAHHLKPKTTLLEIHTPWFGHLLQDFVSTLLENAWNLSAMLNDFYACSYFRPFLVMHSFPSGACFIHHHIETWLLQLTPFCTCHMSLQLIQNAAAHVTPLQCSLRWFPVKLKKKNLQSQKWTNHFHI